MNTRNAKPMRKFVVPILFLVLSLVASCAGPTTATPVPQPTAAGEATQGSEPTPVAEPTTEQVILDDEQILRFASLEEDAPRGFDPTLSTTTPSMDIQKVIYNGLLRLRPDANNYLDTEPDLATRWEGSEDGLTWTFYLREGVQFQKGFGEMTSEDVVFTFERARAPGASWAVTFQNFKTVEAIDKYTVRIVLSAPDPYFLYKMSNGGDVAGVIVSKKAVEQYGDDFAFNPIGTGPFQFGAYFPKEKVVLVRNEDYFRGAPILEQLEYLFIPEMQAQTLALQAGEIEMMRGLPDPTWVDQMESKGFKILQGVPFGLPLMLNMVTKPFDDLRVRQAVIYGIDRHAFADFFGEEFIVTDPIGYSPWPWHMAEYAAARDVVQHYEYDPDKARALLAEAGYPDGLTIDLIWTNQARFFDPIQIVQAELEKVGIHLNLTIVENSVYRQTIDGPGQPISMISISRDTPDAVAREWFLTSSIPPDGATAKYNYAHYTKLEDLIQQALVARSPEEAVPLYVEMQRLAMEDLPIIPLFQGYSEPFALAPWVDLGYEYNAPDRRYPVFTELTRIFEH